MSSKVKDPFDRKKFLQSMENLSWYQVLPGSQRDEIAMLSARKGRRLPSIPGLDMNQFRSDLDLCLSDCMPSFKLDYLRQELWSKYCDAGTVPAHVRREAAIDKWMAAEHLNHRTNVRLYQQDNILGVDFHVFVSEVREIISRVLGSVDEVDLTAASFTNGASLGVRRSNLAALRKLMGEQHVSPSALKWYIGAFSGTILGAGQSRGSATHISGVNQGIQLSASSQLFTVPKKTEIDRCACKEPAGNALLQRSVGLHIRKRLKSVNIDLQDQTRNQYMAYIGSLAGDYATIDLSSASDTMTTSLVAILLPGEWWCLLDDIRVKSTWIPSRAQLKELEMFSSMGNGFTFELETLIFYAIARATMQRMNIRGRCLVYGDDIVVPSAVTKTLLRTLRCFGFIPNAKKTHFGSQDLFRESCGKHYHKGFDVSPFYIRGPIVDYTSLINILNQLLDWDARGWGFFIEPSLADFWGAYRRFIPPYLWGGVSTDDPYALVTGDTPRLRLTNVAVHKMLGAGYSIPKLAHWCMQRRNTDIEIGGDPGCDYGLYRLDTNPAAWGTTSYQPLELKNA